MKKLSRLLALAAALLCLCTEVSGASGTPAGVLALPDLTAVPDAPEVSAKHAVLYDMNSGTVLCAKDAYSRAYPASITKVMTALLTVERCDMNETVTFSYNACHNYDRESSNIARTEGEQMSVIDCLYGMMLASANEVALALGEHISGNTRSFTALMNQRARQLGCLNTHFANPNGLHDDDHYTCCYDMALIMTEAMKHPELQEIMGTYMYEIPPTNKHAEITYVHMQHPLVTPYHKMQYPDAVAGKTGYTDVANYTLVTYAARGDQNLIGVVMDAESQPRCGEDSVSLFEYGFENFTTYSLTGFETTYGAEGPLSSNILRLTPAEAAYLTLPNRLVMEDLRIETRYSGSSDEETVAHREYYLGNVLLCSVPLTATGGQMIIPLEGTVSVAKTTKEKLRTRYLGVPLIYWIVIGGCLLILFLIVLTVLSFLRALKRRKREQLRRRKSMADRLRE